MKSTAPLATAPVLDDCVHLREVLARLGERWTLQVLNQIGTDRMRFNELHRAAPGISQRMLSVTLRNLERDGLVTRTSYPAVPPWVEYEVSALGRSLAGPLDTLMQWMNANQATIAAARRRFDALAKPRDT